MHGQKKNTFEDLARKKERDLKAKAYQNGMQKISDKWKTGEKNEEVLELISDVLVLNPDVYSLWNYRKEVLLTFKDKSHDDLACIISNEMRLTEMCLRENPKSYSAWFHRLWILDNMPNPDLEKELFLCTKYLKLDERNFHCWNYRRAVVQRLDMAPSDELDYTTLKIEENFSNYSSWHYRSKLLPLVKPDQSGVRPIEETSHLEELELVQSACFTDPYDSSSWFYLRWLLGRPTVHLSPIQAFVNNGNIFCVFNQPVSSICHPWTQYDKSRYIWSKPLLEGESENNISFSIEYGSEKMENVTISKDKPWITRPKFDLAVSSGLMSVLCSTLDSCTKLLELEPHNKWTLLTSVVLMQAIDRKKYNSKICSNLEILKRVDAYRKKYYCDMRSKFVMEEQLETLDFSNDIVFHCVDLTTLYHLHYLAYAPKVNISDNKLKRSLPLLALLINCEELKLERNGLKTLQGFPSMPNLKRLSLSGNKFASPDAIIPYIKNNCNLIKLNLSANNNLSHAQCEFILKQLNIS